jgi:transposase
VDWLAAHGANVAGLEASGGYEQAACRALTAAGLAVHLHQPLEVRLFARLNRRRAKNDRLDARLIALATARLDTLKAFADPGLAELQQRLTAYEQASDRVSTFKTQLEHVDLADLRTRLLVQLETLIAYKKALADDLEQRLKAHPDLSQRLELLRSLPGFGPIVAMGCVIRMPELGSMRPGQPAALLGVAPFDNDSGPRRGKRCIAGGRTRPRGLVYMAALAAKRHDPAFKAFAQRLSQAGKPPKLIIVAIMRKLIEAANLVLARNAPWQKTQS